MATPTHHLARPEGRIAYAVDGPADGPLVVLVPGMGDLRATWRELVAPLTAAGHRVAALDLRGHGDSDATFTAHGVEPIADDVRALLDALLAPGERAVLVGSSVGAGAVARVAADDPGRVAGVVLVAFAANDAGPGSRTVRLQAQVLMRHPWGPRGWAWFYRSINRGRRAPWLDAHLADLRADLHRPGHLRSLRDLALTLTDGRQDVRAAQVHAPVLVVTGALDPESPDPAAELERTTARFTSAARVTPVLVPDCGHYPQHQAPDVVVPAVLDFLASLPAARA